MVIGLGHKSLGIKRGDEDARRWKRVGDGGGWGHLLSLGKPRAGIPTMMKNVLLLSLASRYGCLVLALLATLPKLVLAGVFLPV